MGKKFFNGSTKDGYMAYINSINEISKKSTEKISNYDELKEIAKDQAISKVKLLCEAICRDDKNVSVNF